MNEHDLPEAAFVRQLKEYESAVRFSLVTASSQRNALIEMFNNREASPLPDRHFQLRGTLGGVEFKAGAELTPEQAADPRNIIPMLKQLFEGFVRGIDQYAATVRKVARM